MGMELSEPLVSKRMGKTVLVNIQKPWILNSRTVQQIWTIPSVFILFGYKERNSPPYAEQQVFFFFLVCWVMLIVNCDKRQKESESWAINIPVSSQSRTATVRQKSVLNHWCCLRNVCSSAWAVYCHWYWFTNTMRTWTLRSHWGNINRVFRNIFTKCHNLQWCNSKRAQGS